MITFCTNTVIMFCIENCRRLPSLFWLLLSGSARLLSARSPDSKLLRAQVKDL
jgi:hypothetical protein